MANRMIYVDKTEIVFLVLTKKKFLNHNLTAKDIIRIQFDKTTSKLLGFIKSEDETITVASSKLSAPIVYKRSENKKHFDDYKRELEKFAKENYVTFTDNTKEDCWKVVLFFNSRSSHVG